MIRDYFYLLTATRPNGAGHAEAAGVVGVGPGTTRLAVYQKVRADLCAKVGSDLTVTSFTLEPNTLGEAA